MLGGCPRRGECRNDGTGVIAKRLVSAFRFKGRQHGRRTKKPSSSPSFFTPPSSNSAPRHRQTVISRATPYSFTALVFCQSCFPCAITDPLVLLLHPCHTHRPSLTCSGLCEAVIITPTVAPLSFFDLSTARRAQRNMTDGRRSPLQFVSYSCEKHTRKLRLERERTSLLDSQRPEPRCPIAEINSRGLWIRVCLFGEGCEEDGVVVSCFFGVD